MTPEFYSLAIGGALFYAVLFSVDRKWGRQLLNKDFSERERVLAASIMKSEQAYTRMEATIDVLTEQIQIKDDQITQMRQSSQDRDGRISELTSEVYRLELIVADLTRQLQEKKVIEKSTQAPTVLALWPTPPGQPSLDQKGESDALYNSGFAYTALRGKSCNRAGVVLEIDRVRPTIIQVGGHGTDEGLLLTDGIAEPGWWGEVVAGKGVQLMVLLSCHASQQDEINISDALIRVGVTAVVSCDDAIDDNAAVKFAELLYAKLSENLPLATAVSRAKLGVSRRNAEMIRLRERNA